MSTIMDHIGSFHLLSSLLLIPPSPKFLTTSHLFTAFIGVPFPECQTVGILRHVASSEWLLSVSGVQITPLPVFFATV